MKEEKSLQKLEEEILSEQEAEQLEGGIEPILGNNSGGKDVDDTNYFQCGCDNYQCGKKSN